jgi:RNA polymerase sigma factor (sigma-70 family)
MHELLARAAWARRLARQLVRREDEAEDLLQEAWLVAAGKEPRSPAAMRVWLKGVLRVLGMRRARAAGRRRQRESESVTEAATAALHGAAPPDDLVDQVQTQRRLSEALLALDEPYRTTVLLRYYEELSAAEIARRTRVPAGTVRWRLKEGLDRLRRGLDEREGGRRASALALLHFVRRGRAPRARWIARGLGLAASGVAVVGLVALLVHARSSIPRETLSTTRRNEGAAAQGRATDESSMKRRLGAAAAPADLATNSGVGAGADDRRIPPSKVPRFWVPLGMGPVKGPPTARVTILAFMDYQSPLCQRASQSIDALLTAHAGNVRYQVIHRPLPIHPRASYALRAALAAGQQGRFWQMHELLFANQTALEATDIDGYAQQIGLDRARFQADIDGPTVMNQAELEEANAQSVGIDAVPAFFFNGRAVFGARPRAELERALVEELAYADAVLSAGVEPADLYNTITKAGATALGRARDRGNPAGARDRGQRGPEPGGRRVFDAAWDLVNGNVAAVNACYEAERATRPALAGRVVLDLTLAAGRAPAIVIGESTLNDATVERCIVRSMSDLQLPSPEGSGAVRLRRLFTFPAEASSERPSERGGPTRANGDRP